MKGKLKDVQGFLFVLVAVVVVNWLGSSLFFRIDMTEDDRYSLSPSSIRVVEDMKGEVEVEIFLHGDFPAQYKILEQSIEEKLQDLKAYAGGDLSYYFTDPFAITNKKERTALLQSLQQRGIVPISLNDTEEGKRVEKLIFPGAIVRFGQRELAVNFVKGMMMDGDNGKIQEAVQGIEYELVHSLKTVMQEKRKRVAFLLGHGELDQRQVQDLVANLSPNYDVGFFNLAVNPSIDSIDAIVIAQPTKSFSPIDQYKIDQFIMKGGKALFFLDMVETRKSHYSISLFTK